MVFLSLIFQYDIAVYLLIFCCITILVIAGSLLSFQDFTQDHNRQDSDMNALGQELERSLQMSDEENENAKIQATAV